jgi:hypothetical protein
MRQTLRQPLCEGALLMPPPDVLKSAVEQIDLQHDAISITLAPQTCLRRSAHPLTSDWMKARWC